MKLYIDNFKTYWKEHIIHIWWGRGRATLPQTWKRRPWGR